MTGALPKWEAALDTFDRIKHKFRAPGQIEKALNSIALDERVLLFRGSDSDIVERLSWYDQVEEPSVEDTSEVLCEGLLQPPLLILPQTPDHLADILFAQPADPIPIDKDVYSTLTANYKKMFVVNDGSGTQLARIVANQITSKLWLGGGEQDAVHNVNMGLIVPLLGFDDLAIGSCQGFEAVRDKGGPDSTMTLLSAKGVSLRPDGVIRSRDDHRLLMKWEEKPVSLRDAVADLKDKTAQWSKLYYGQLPYLVTFAATQTHIQFYVIMHNNVAQPAAVGPKIMLNKCSGRVQLLLAALNLHRILQAVEKYLPQEVLPVDQPQVRQCPEHDYIREVVFRSDLTVHKVIKGWSNFQAAWFADIELLEQVYRVTHDSAGIVHALEGPVVNVSSRSKRKSSMPNLADDHYSVVMQPVGLRGADAMPQNEAQLARAAHGCLHGLQALHQADLVHRDLRWPNGACSIDRADFLLDLETCHCADRTPEIYLFIWEGLLQDTKYTKASDICLLGRMLCDLTAMRQHLSPEGTAFKHLISLPVGQASTAVQLLHHPWIVCQGQDCRVAGAQPSERHVA